MTMPKFKGEKKHSLTYLGEEDRNTTYYPYTYTVKVKCDCGKEYWIDTRNFGRIKMCGSCAAKKRWDKRREKVAK